jgi:hypothetical protein
MSSFTLWKSPKGKVNLAWVKDSPKPYQVLTGTGGLFADEKFFFDKEKALAYAKRQARKAQDYQYPKTGPSTAMEI